MSQNWIVQSEQKPNKFIIDADLAYRRVIEDVMDVIGTDEIDQYVLEIAHIFIKLDASVWIAKNGYRTPGVFSELKICGSAGYKERWGWRAHPPGKWADLRVENEQKYAAQCALDAREYYKQSRGFYPS